MKIVDKVENLLNTTVKSIVLNLQSAQQTRVYVPIMHFTIRGV